MKIPESLEELPTNGTRGRVYGEPYRTADGGTVITVAKVRAGTATPVGLFVVHGGRVRWVPAIDANRIALIGVITGLIAATLASLAVLRRPPWPDLSATSSAWLHLRPLHGR
jgi:hypothetical protein